MPQRVSAMETLGNGIITLANGAWLAVDMVVSPITLALAALGAGLLWLALIECDELDRQGTKPEVGLH